MTVQERLAKIDAKVASDKEAHCKAILKESVDRDEMKHRIHELQPRIEKLLQVANYAVENNISLDGRRAWGGHEGYDTQLFYSNSWSHLVGFISEGKNRPIQYVGIIAGGACGDVNFITNGTHITGRRKSENVQPITFHMRKFLEEFDTFETAFYEFIDNL